MLAKYRTIFSLGSQDHYKQILQSQKWRQKVNTKENKPFDDLIITTYKLSDTKSVVEKWRKYINIFGWFLIVYGSLELIAIFFSLLLVDSVEYEVIKPDGSSDTIYSSIIWEIINRILSDFTSMSIIFLGMWWRGISSLPTRSETWKLWKVALFITAFQAVIIWMQFFFAGISITDVINKWQERHDVPAGNYIFRNKKTGDDYKYYKPVARSEIAMQKEFDTKQQVNKIFLMSVISTLCWSWCYLAIYCAMTLLALYRFHSATKELEIMVEFSTIREMSLNRQESSSISQEQSNPYVENEKINIIPDL